MPATGGVESSCLLDAAGNHRILVYDSSGLQTGDYRIVLEKFPAPVGCTPLTIGTPLTVNVNDPGELACLTFAGALGDRFRVRSISTGGAWNPVTEVFRPDGTSLCPNTFSDQFDCGPANAGGNHTILVRDASGNGQALGTARVVVQRLNNPTPCPAIAFGATGVTATIGQTAEIDCRTRAGVAGQRWLIRVVETSGSATLVHEVVRPDGTTVCAGDGRGRVELPARRRRQPPDPRL